MSQLKLACAAIQAPFWLNLFVEDYISQFSFPLSFPGDVFGDFLPTLARSQGCRKVWKSWGEASSNVGTYKL